MRKKRIIRQGRQRAAELEEAVPRENNKKNGVESALKKRRKAVRYFAVLAVAVALIVAFAAVSAAAPTGIPEWISVKLAEGRSEGKFPVLYDASDAERMYYNNDLLTVATATDLKAYTNSGAEVFSRMHGFADAVVKTSAVRSLIFDMRGNQYKIENAAKELHSKKTETPIITADISDSGTYAIATQGKDDVALVTVYDKNNLPVYEYHSSNYYVSAVSVSEDGKKLAVAAFTAKKAKLSFKLLMYNINQESPYASCEFNDEIVFAAEFTDNNRCAVITDKCFASVVNSDNVSRLEFNSKKLFKYGVTPHSMTVLVLSVDAYSSEKRILFVKPDGSVCSDFNIDNDVVAVSASTNRIAILSEVLYDYNSDGTLVNEYAIKQGARDVAVIGSKIAVLYASGIEIYG